RRAMRAAVGCVLVCWPAADTSIAPPAINPVSSSASTVLSAPIRGVLMRIPFLSCPRGDATGLATILARVQHPFQLCGGLRSPAPRALDHPSSGSSLGPARGNRATASNLRANPSRPPRLSVSLAHRKARAVTGEGFWGEGGPLTRRHF